MQKVNKATGEINSIQPGGLYAPLPVPAYQVLARMKEHQAQRVLISLISHLGMNGRESFPSYNTIARESGVGKNAIRKSLDTLENLGFIKIFTINLGKRKRNKYFIQEAAYNSGLMNKSAIKFRSITARCRRCGSGIDRGGYGLGLNGPIHFGCGGNVQILDSESSHLGITKVSYIR